MLKFESIKWFVQNTGAWKFLDKRTRHHGVVKVGQGSFDAPGVSRVHAVELAIITVVLAWLIDLVLGERFSNSSGALFVAAAFISTWFGGLACGLMAVALTTAINLIFFDHPDLALAVGVHGLDPLLFVVIVSVALCVLRRQQKLVCVLNTELEHKIEQRTAALNESNQRLEAFCYTLAHDLKAPLRSIEGFADLVITDYSSRLDEVGRDAMDRIRNSAERMARLIGDLLAYTRLSREDFRKQSVDLQKVWHAVVPMFANEITALKAEIYTNLPARYVQGDAVGIERILVNLLGNALKFTCPKRTPKIRLSSEYRPPNVRISLEDNGIGLEPQFKELIFGVFERLRPADGPDGTGMGLAIVKRSVETMGGKTGVESEPNEGSCFWFELPQAELTPEDSKRQS